MINLCKKTIKFLNQTHRDRITDRVRKIKFTKQLMAYFRLFVLANCRFAHTRLPIPGWELMQNIQDVKKCGTDIL